MINWVVSRLHRRIIIALMPAIHFNSLRSFKTLINLTLVFSVKANVENCGAGVAEKVEDVPQKVCTKMYGGLEIKKICEVQHLSV